MAASVKMAVLWVIAPFNVVEFADVSQVLVVSIIRAISLLA
jgi:hypothetical protein